LTALRSTPHPSTWHLGGWVAEAALADAGLPPPAAPPPADTPFPFLPPPARRRRRAPAGGSGRVLLEVDLLAKREPVDVVAPGATAAAGRHCHPLPCFPWPER